jgi:hypothetical protein
MKTPVNRHAIAGAAVVGFCVPFVLFLFESSFSGRDRIRCRFSFSAAGFQPCSAQPSPSFWEATPFINALIYGLLAYAVLRAKSKTSKAEGETSC